MGKSTEGKGKEEGWLKRICRDVRRDAGLSARVGWGTSMRGWTDGMERRESWVGGCSVLPVCCVVLDEEEGREGGKRSGAGRGRWCWC